MKRLGQQREKGGAFGSRNLGVGQGWDEFLGGEALSNHRERLLLGNARQTTESMLRAPALSQ
jgi:hypothetical protein